MRFSQMIPPTRMHQWGWKELQRNAAYLPKAFAGEVTRRVDNYNYQLNYEDF
jgi:hypothetical protein